MFNNLERNLYMAQRSKSVYVCSNCSYESAKWYGKCPSCGEWNTMEEQASVPVKGKSSISSRGIPIAPVQKLNEINSDIENRLRTGIGEFDRVLGLSLIHI